MPVGAPRAQPLATEGLAVSPWRAPAWPRATWARRAWAGSAPALTCPVLLTCQEHDLISPPRQGGLWRHPTPPHRRRDLPEVPQPSRWPPPSPIICPPLLLETGPGLGSLPVLSWTVTGPDRGTQDSWVDSRHGGQAPSTARCHGRKTSDGTLAVPGQGTSALAHV